MPKECDTVQFLNSNILDITGAGKRGLGEAYGIELELEGRGVALADIPTKGWKRNKDGSLRGESVEYVFNGPAGFIEAQKRVVHLFNLFDKNKVELKNSYRTSTHIHINFADNKVNDALKFFVVYTILEELLEIYCGEGREGNLFCMPSRDVETIVQYLERALNKFGSFYEFDDNIRYCAVNLCALSKFGSIEVRTMRGADNAEQVLDWLSVVKQMRDFSVNKMTTPARFIESLSMLGAEGFLSQIFDDKTVENLMEAWARTGKNLRQSLYEGARLLQVFAYRFDDDFAAEVKDVVPPFPKQNPPVEKHQGVRLIEWYDPLNDYICALPPDGRGWGGVGYLAGNGRVYKWNNLMGKWLDSTNQHWMEVNYFEPEEDEEDYDDE